MGTSRVLKGTKEEQFVEFLKRQRGDSLLKESTFDQIYVCSTRSNGVCAWANLEASPEIPIV